MALKPQDVVVVLKLVVRRGRPWAYADLSHELGLSSSAVHACVQRAIKSRLLRLQHPHAPARLQLMEFLVHGLKYAFPAEYTGVTRGLPTSHAAPPLLGKFIGGDDLPPVWPDPKGTVRGEGVEPLYRSVVHAARADAALYELLVLADAMRIGRARDREIAAHELRSRIGA